MIAPSAKLSSGHEAPRSNRRHEQHAIIISPRRPRPPPVHLGRTRFPARHAACHPPPWNRSRRRPAHGQHTCRKERRPVTTRTRPATQVSGEPRAVRPTNYPDSSSRFRFCCSHISIIARRLPHVEIGFPARSAAGHNPKYGCRTRRETKLVVIADRRMQNGPGPNALGNSIELRGSHQSTVSRNSSVAVSIRTLRVVYSYLYVFLCRTTTCDI